MLRPGRGEGLFKLRPEGHRGRLVGARLRLGFISCPGLGLGFGACLRCGLSLSLRLLLGLGALVLEQGLKRFLGLTFVLCTPRQKEFSGRAVPVEDIHRDRQLAHPILVLLTQVKAVEAVEQGEVITLPRQQMLPAAEALDPAVGNGRFHQHDPRPAVAEIKAPQGLLFHAFNVDLEKVRRAETILPAHLAHGPDLGLRRAGVTADRPRQPRRLLALERAQSRADQLVQGSFIGRFARADVQVDIPGPLGLQLVEERAHRLHVNPGPAALVKGIGDGIRDRLGSPKIDVPPLLHVIQRPPQQHVFAVLGMGDKGRHQLSLISIRGSCHETPSK